MLCAAALHPHDRCQVGMIALASLVLSRLHHDMVVAFQQIRTLEVGKGCSRLYAVLPCSHMMMV